MKKSTAKLLSLTALFLLPFWAAKAEVSTGGLPETGEKMGSEPLIVDVSQWQNPDEMDYGVLASQIDLAIVRVQKGGYMEDIHYHAHIENFQRYGVPVNVYAFCLADDEDAARGEAQMFYERTKNYNIATYWIDIEWDVAEDTAGTIEAYRQELKRLAGEKTKVGVYLQDDLYDIFSIDTRPFDGVWTALYDYKDDGSTHPHYTGKIPYAFSDMHQFSENGHLNGYDGYLDFSRLTQSRGRGIEYFGYKQH